MKIQIAGKVNGKLEHIKKGTTVIVEGHLLLVTDKIEKDDILCVELSTGTTHMVDKEQCVDEIETKIVAYANYDALYAERRE